MDTDVHMLIPEPDIDGNINEFNESPEELSRTFCRIGITQLVLGIVVLGGGIATSLDGYHEDGAGEGTWGGIIVLVCGSLAIASRYHMLSGVVIASFVMNLVSVLVLLAGIILACISTFHDFLCEYCGRKVNFFGFMALNCGLIACLIISIYMAIIYGKILHEKTNFMSECCKSSPSQNPSDYTMVYVPPGMEQSPAAPHVGAFMAVPAVPSV